ncbi:MAG: DUF2953 domain-containing protein [Clostridium argentinense]|uniref:DUF2953 domain-containing protein n=1 Tax=Clostridium faecium TaxID=2762223 RepID=A0ABR8YWP2_9CLOT|nr:MULTISPECIES: DUF2953 domain-containing protein [Clostridium]MBD8048413.1 DUF2953 domain-containing protein [Clostridium faecium]MBS5824088.1 DUF2953 domain-containing protein [Clostridium argentinense]
MKIIFILLLIFAMILLFPIPLKIKLIYLDQNFQMFIYNKKLNLNKKEDIDNVKKVNKKFKYKDIIKRKSKKLTLKHYKRILRNLRKIKYKISIKLYNKINYSFEDAAATAIIYGYLHQGFSLLYGFLNHFFSVKDFNTDIQAEYNKSYINLEIKGIVLFNFAKLIYIYYIINKSIKEENKIHQCKNLRVKEET